MRKAVSTMLYMEEGYTRQDMTLTELSFLCCLLSKEVVVFKLHLLDSLNKGHMDFLVLKDKMDFSRFEAPKYGHHTEIQ